MNSINDHRMAMAEWKPTPHLFGWMKPTLIVVHETGTRITPGSAVAYCRAPRSTNPIRVSYHIVIERDGTIVQLAPFNQKLRHAGASRWKGREYCNSFSIGIGLVGPTELKGTERRAKSYYGKWFTSEDGIKAADGPYHGRGHIWLPHTTDQIVALDEVVAELRDAYPDIEDVKGHYHVSPRRKIDPSPLVDFSRIGILDELDEQPESVSVSAHEIAHATDQLSENAPVANATSKTDRDNEVDKILKAESREYGAANTLEKGTAGVIGATAVSEGVKSFIPADAGANLSYLTTLKSYMDVVGGMVSAYGVPIIIVAGVIVYGYCLFIKKWKRESYVAGLYEPSGAGE